MKRKKWIKMLILVLVFSLFASGCETKKKREEIARAEYIEEYGNIKRKNVRNSWKSIK